MSDYGTHKLRGIPVAVGQYTTGDVWYVDSGSGSDSNNGKTPKAPFASWDWANGQCTASNGDIIYLMPGHAETITSAITLDVAGVTVIGIGNGDNRPTITVNGGINGLNVTADDIAIHNVRLVSGSSATAAGRLVRVAASDIEFTKCSFELPYDMYHVAATISGDNIKFLDSTFINSVTTNADAHPQTAVLNHLATNVLVKGCRFNDTGAYKAERWRACCEGGGLASSMVVEDCTFVCRGVATRTRSAGASDGTGNQSPTMATLYCRAISPSSNTSVGSLYTPTYQYIIESYNVAAINKVGVVSVTTSDIRLKLKIVYL